MPTPRNDSYTVASGSSVYGGRLSTPPNPGGMPAWRNGLTPFVWVEIPTGNNLIDVDPSNNPTYNPNYPSRAPWTRLVSGNANSSNNNPCLTAWCGSVIDDSTGTVYVPLSGGHSDYGGNEPYKLTLGADVPMWSMIRPPSASLPLIAGGIPAGATVQGNSYLLDDGPSKEITGVYADGRPRAIHSYRKHVWVPGQGVVMSVQGSTFSTPGTSNKSTWTMDVNTGEWTFRVEPASSFGNTSGGGACYDSLRNKIYFALPGTSRVARLDIATWTWDYLTSASINNSGNAAVYYAADIDRVLFIGNTGSIFKVINPSTGVINSPTFDALPVTLAAPMGLEYIDGRGLIVHPFDVTTGAVYQLSTPADPDNGNWAASTLATTGTPPGNASGVGWWSRFVYSKKLKGIYRLNTNTVKPWFLPLE